MDFRHSKAFKIGIAVMVTLGISIGITGIQYISNNSVGNVEESNGNADDVVYNDFKEASKDNVIELIGDDKVKGIIKSGGVLYLVSVDGKQLKVKSDAELESYAELYGLEVENLVNIGLDDNKEKNIEGSGGSTGLMGYITEFMSTFLVIGLIVWIVVSIKTTKDSMYTVSNVGLRDTSSDSKSRGSEKEDSKDDSVPRIGFKDVQGVDELKHDINRVVDYLKDKEKYIKMGARAPKGVILYGPPGTGKTLIAKAIAGEAGVPFFSMAGSDFVEVYVGLGAKRVRELYQKARKAAPCIVFIDEVDAIAHKRGNENTSEDDKTINALLKELDGFDSNSGVITICATNRLDLLDSAFQRSGRFDLKLAVGLPDKVAREEILKIHSKNKILSKDIDLGVLAVKTVGFSGADLEALLNESALLAASNNKVEISNSDIEDAFYKIILKGNKRGVSGNSKVKEITAWHEAGHTLATKLLTNDSVPTVTIISSTSGAGGVTFRAPEENGLTSKKYLKSLIKVMYAGRAAEEIYLGNSDDITTGASEDIKQATNILKGYIENYGMGDSGLLDMSQFIGNKDRVLDEAKELSGELYKEVKGLLELNYTKLSELSDALIEKETLVESEIDKIIYEEILE